MGQERLLPGKGQSALLADKRPLVVDDWEARLPFSIVIRIQRLLRLIRYVAQQFDVVFDEMVERGWLGLAQATTS